MNIKVIAAILLLLRVISVVSLSGVLKRQWGLFKVEHTRLTKVRITLLILVGITFVSNILPIIIDLATIFGRTYAGRLLVPYAFSNAIGITSMSVAWWYLYRSIAREGIGLQHENERLTARNVTLTKDNKAMKKREK